MKLERGCSINERKLSAKEILGPDDLTGEFLQTFEELIPVFHKLFQQNKRKQHFLTCFMRLVLRWSQNQTKSQGKIKTTDQYIRHKHRWQNTSDWPRWCTVAKWSRICSVLEKQEDFQPRVLCLVKLMIRKWNQILRHFDTKNNLENLSIADDLPYKKMLNRKSFRLKGKNSRWQLESTWKKREHLVSFAFGFRSHVSHYWLCRSACDLTTLTFCLSVDNVGLITRAGMERNTCKAPSKMPGMW